MKEETRLQDLNDIQERKYIIKMIQKLKYSSKIYTEEEINTKSIRTTIFD